MSAETMPAVVPGRSTLGWLTYGAGTPQLGKWGTDGQIVYQRSIANGRLSEVTAFIPAVAIPVEALDELRKIDGDNLIDPNDPPGSPRNKVAFRALRRVRDFLTAVDNANGAKS